MELEPADHAWITLGAGILAWDVACLIVPSLRGQMLSQASARYKATHPVAWTTTIVYFGGHLLHVWKPRYDPLTRLATALGR